MLEEHSGDCCLSPAVPLHSAACGWADRHPVRSSDFPMPERRAVLVHKPGSERRARDRVLFARIQAGGCVLTRPLACQRHERRRREAAP